MRSSKRPSKPFQVPSTSKTLRVFLPAAAISVVDIFLFYEHIIFLWQDYHVSISYQSIAGFDAALHTFLSVDSGPHVDFLVVILEVW